MVLLVLLVGIVGFYTIEDYNLLDSIFMTVITIATVGYREVKELDDAGKIFGH